MIKLKSGTEIKYTDDFDVFFKNLLQTIILESQKAIHDTMDNRTIESLHDLLLKEMMDNCIFVTHQLFEISKVNEEFSKFIVSGFIFNSLVLTLPEVLKDITSLSKNDKERDIIH